MNNELNTNTVKEEQKDVNEMKKPQPLKLGKVTTYEFMSLDRALGYIRNKQAKEVIINHIANLETDCDMASKERRRLENENKALLLALEALGDKHNGMMRDLEYYKRKDFYAFSANRLSRSGDKTQKFYDDKEMNY